MKKYFAIIILLFYSSLFGQWSKVTSFTGTQVYKITNLDSLILISSNGLYASTDTCKSWFPLYQGGYINALDVINNSIYIGNFYSNKYSTNRGLNWFDLNLPRFLYTFALMNNHLFAGTESYGIYVTTNLGQNWVFSGLPGRDVLSSIVFNNKIYAGTSDIGILVSSDFGQSWDSTSMKFQGVLNISAASNKMYAGTSTGLYISLNNGTNWTLISPLNIFVTSVVNVGNNIIISSRTGVYTSNNNGVNWISHNEGLTDLNINYIMVLGNYLFAGSNTEGLLKRNLNEIVSIKNVYSELPNAFSLEQNYPNPFNSMTNVKFEIVNAGMVEIKVFDLSGKEVRTLVNEYKQAGTYEVRFDAGDLPSGIYFYRMETNGFISTKKCVLLK